MKHYYEVKVYINRRVVQTTIISTTLIICIKGIENIANSFNVKYKQT